ncbi:transposase family protein [Vibrio cholerae HE-40]|jgi:transposase|uniref:transposase n=1 Tax=Vibrio cholerae TaxID=666 RepID=UPI00028C6419|nr:transposase [Vibrio cholerae]EKL33381.1 transposase family protein [Vibrio cholerae HE-40]EKL37284.1 transposase family protein [Vibrio cholerae HE-46]ORP20910.1 transposase [Vibrio cholerae]
MPELKQSDVRRVFSPEFKWQLVQESKEHTLSVSELARKYDVNTNQVFRWVREVDLGKALWVRRAKGEVNTPVAPTPFLPVSVRTVNPAPVLHQPQSAITVSFRSGHQLVLHEVTPGMVQQLVAALL